MKRMHRFGGAAVAACVLAACGGGGDGGAPVAPPTASTAQGLRTSSSGGVTILNVNLDNDQFWTIYNVSGFGYAGVMQGSHTVNGNALTGSGTDYSAIANTATTFTLTGTFTAQGAASGTITPSTGAPYAFNLTYDTRYDQAAVQSDVSGTWTLLALGATTTVSIAPDGSLTGSNTACTLSGSVRPRANGKNVFDASVGFGGGACPLVGQTFTGIALALRNGASTDLVVAMLNGARTTALLVAGTR